MLEDISFQIVLIVAGGVAAQWVAWRLRTPAILFLLAFGFLVGPVLGLLNPTALLGDLFKPAIEAAVAIILFEGALQLHFKELRETRAAVRRVILLGAPVGWILISLAGKYIAGLEWAVAITLGGMLVVTGPTVIMPLLRQARLNQRVGSVLKWEGIVNDPVGIIFAVLSYEYFIASRDGVAGMGFFIGHGAILVGVCALSLAAGYFIKFLFERGHVPEYLKSPFLFAFVLVAFFGCNILLDESGLFAVTILGLTLANLHTGSLEGIKRFKESMTILLVSGVFILLTADLDGKSLLNISWQGVVFILALLFVIRPLTIAICSLGSGMTRQEIFLAGMIAPRGVVCAAMAGVIGPLLSQAGFADGDKILPIAFAVVVISVTLHSLIIKPLARRLDLTTKETNGVIVAGAYPWSIQLTEVLKGKDVPVMLVDSNWLALGQARLANIPIYYGEMLSDETEFALEFNKYNTLIAATENPAYNLLLCEKFGHEYGSERMFRLNLQAEDVSARHKFAGGFQGRVLVSPSFSLSFIEEKFHEGWRFRAVRIGRMDKGSDLIIPEQGENRLLIGLVSKTGTLSFYTKDAVLSLSPKEDDIIIVFEKIEEARS